jgi:hypothetical protein
MVDGPFFAKLDDRFRILARSRVRFASGFSLSSWIAS